MIFGSKGRTKGNAADEVITKGFGYNLLGYAKKVIGGLHAAQLASVKDLSIGENPLYSAIVAPPPIWSIFPLREHCARSFLCVIARM